MSRRVDMRPSKVEPDKDIVTYRDDGGYLLMRDSERVHVMNWIRKVTCSTYDGYAEVMYLLQGRKK